MPAYRITDKGKYSQIVAYVGSKIESRWAVGKQVYIDFEGPDFVVSSKDGVFLQIPIANIAEPQTQTNADLIQALAFMVSASEGYEDDSIYVSDGTLTDNRTLLGGAYDLLFSDIDEFEVSSRVNRLTASESNILTGRNILAGPQRETPIKFIGSDYTVNFDEDYTLIATAPLTVTLPDTEIGNVVQVVSNGFTVFVEGDAGILIDSSTSFQLIQEASLHLTYTSQDHYKITASDLGAAALINIPRAFGSAINSPAITVINAVNTWTRVATPLVGTDVILFNIINDNQFQFVGPFQTGFKMRVTGDIYNLGDGIANVYTDLSIFRNGVPLPTEQEILTDLTPVPISLQASAIVQPNDIIDLRIRNTTNTTNVRIENLQLSINP